MTFNSKWGEGMKKRILSLVLCLAMVVTSSLCGFVAFAKTKTELEEDIKKCDELKILSTSSPLITNVPSSSLVIVNGSSFLNLYNT